MVVIQLVGLDSADADVLLRALRRDLVASGTAESATLGMEGAPDGAKGDGSLAGELLVQLSGSTFAAVAGFVGAWLSQRRRKCTISYRLPGGVTVELPSVQVEQVADQLPEELRSLIQRDG